MQEESEPERIRRIVLFVSSDCEECDRAAAFLHQWAVAHAGTMLEIVPVLCQQEQIIRMGITHTPALVVDGKLLAQRVSVSMLADLMRRCLSGSEA